MGIAYHDYSFLSLICKSYFLNHHFFLAYSSKLSFFDILFLNSNFYEYNILGFYNYFIMDLYLSFNSQFLQKLSYFSTNNEVDLEALTEMRLKRNLLTTFPRVEPNHSMSLIAPKDFQKLNKNKFEIFEPSDGDEINPIDHEIIIIPTVGVDQNGYRLGYGGGYYDRFLESVTQKNKKPLLVGLIYDFQFDRHRADQNANLIISTGSHGMAIT